MFYPPASQNRAQHIEILLIFHEIIGQVFVVILPRGAVVVVHGGFAREIALCHPIDLLPRWCRVIDNGRVCPLKSVALDLWKCCKALDKSQPLMSSVRRAPIR